MKSMIRNIIGMLSGLAVLMVTSCVKEQITTQATPETDMVEIALVADMDDETTRLALDGNTTHWEVGDRITVGLVASYFSTLFSTFEIRTSDDISKDGKRATFRGEVTPGSYYGVVALYPASETASNTISLRRDAADNIFMSSYTAYDMPINVNATTTLPIDFKHLMHKIDFNLSLAEGYVSNDLEAESIAIEMTATADGREVKFPLVSNYDIRRDTLTQLKSEAAVTVYGSGSKFHTMLFPMGTMTSVALTFKVYIDGEYRYEIRKPESGTLSTLKMSAGKSTTVNLQLSEDNFVGGGDDIIQKMITLSASKGVILADGVDSAILKVVDENGVDVTTQCDLYYSTGRKAGMVFTTITPKSYSFYAELNGIRSNYITITAKEPIESDLEIIFADGVTLTSGWYDVNKKGAGDNGDINMCWAAASSNMIQWFQDRYKAAGKTLPAGATDGPGVTTYGRFGPYELELMNVFHSQWDNSRGGHMSESIPWYFEGVLNGGEYATAGSQAVPKTAGGFWKSIWATEVYPNIYHGYDKIVAPGVIEYFDTYITLFNNYDLWGNGTDLVGKERLKVFSDLVVEAFEHGMAGLTINLSATLASASHAVTLWGYEIDNATGLVTRLWITDSDDLASEPKTQLLNEYSVSIDEGKSPVKLTGDTRYGACYV
uniref:IdeS/Mac family cysteine endopeptidase n=1 Tax=Alistipes sp. TaxID=1872444 RepID=UPI0040566BA5